MKKRLMILCDDKNYAMWCTNMNYTGIIINESLENTQVLKKIKIIKTKTEIVKDRHKTPWIKQWTLHTVEVDESQAEEIAKILSKSFDSKHNWYADFKNDTIHFIIFRNKVFKVNRSKKEQYAEAVKYGLSTGIPKYQLDFV